MHDITSDAVIIGVDTHKDAHVAVAINGLGARLATASFPVTSQGYCEMAAWAAEFGTVHAFGIEGTGSYGAGLTRTLTTMKLRLIEVGRVNRQLRRRHGKTDTVDAESAARAVLAGDAAFAKLCGVCPVPASSGKTSRHCLNRGGNRRANAALYRVALVRMRHHPPTRAYIQRQTAEGKSPREIRRCLKRYIAREIDRHLCTGWLKGSEASAA